MTEMVEKVARAIAARALENSGVPPDTETPPWAIDMYRDYARVAIEAMGGGWQPIETAPKDGTAVLTYGRAGPIVASWEDGIWVCHNYGYEENGPRKWPTHWMPLPTPPPSPDP